MGSTAPRRPGARLVAREAQDLNVRLGKQIVGLREEAGVTQAELARCAGISQAHLWDIEAGRTDASTAVRLRIGHCLGADLSVRYFPGSGPRIHDRFQAPMVEALIRALGSEWRAQPEVAVPAARGVIDLVLRRPHAGLVVACECHSELRRLEIVLRRLGEKGDALAGQGGGKLDGDAHVSHAAVAIDGSHSVDRSCIRGHLERGIPGEDGSSGGRAPRRSGVAGPFDRLGTSRGRTSRDPRWPAARRSCWQMKPSGARLDLRDCASAV